MKMRALSVSLLVAACAAANAQVLSGVVNPTLSNDFSGSVTPTYSGNTGSFTLNQSTTVDIGTIQNWKFNAQATAGHYLTSVTLSENLSDLQPDSATQFTFAVNKILGSTVFATEEFYTTGSGVAKFVYPGQSPLTDYNALSGNLSVTFDVSDLMQNKLQLTLDQDFFDLTAGKITTTVTQNPVPEPASFAVMAIGAAGLFIRRRRSI